MNETKAWTYMVKKKETITLLTMIIGFLVFAVVNTSNGQLPQPQIPYTPQEIQKDPDYSKYKESVTILNHCFEHAERPNPVQDLVDQGLVSSEFNGETCASVKQFHDTFNQTAIEEGKGRNAAREFLKSLN